MKTLSNEDRAYNTERAEKAQKAIAAVATQHDGAVEIANDLMCWCLHFLYERKADKADALEDVENAIRCLGYFYEDQGLDVPLIKPVHSELGFKYRRLFDGVNDMIKGGRLSESVIPDDFEWLVKSMKEISTLDELQDEETYDSFPCSECGDADTVSNLGDICLGCLGQEEE